MLNGKKKVIAALLAFAVCFTTLFVTDSMQAEAASVTKALEVQVDYAKNAATGDDSGVYIENLISNQKITFGKKYTFSAKLYVPAVYMQSARIWVKPSVNFYNGKGKYLGWAMPKSGGYSYDKNSGNVKKSGDFYVVTVKIPLDNCTGISAKNGKISSGLFVAGFNKAYSGSIYVDDVKITADKKTVANQNFENGKVGQCRYYINSSNKARTPKIVSYTGKTLQVAKTSLSVKKGKKVSIKATALPNAKITYTSSNKKIATVTSKGVVKGIKKGNATILVKANGKTVKVKVTVK